MLAGRGRRQRRPPDDLVLALGDPRVPGQPAGPHRRGVGHGGLEGGVPGGDALGVDLQHRGQVVVLDFWATWCGPCREELPIVESLDKAYAGRPVRILAINSEGDGAPADISAKIKEFAEETSLALRVLPDFDGAVNRAYGIEALPTVVVIDREGVVRYRNVGTGEGMKQILRAQIDSLMEKQSGEVVSSQ